MKIDSNYVYDVLQRDLPKRDGGERLSVLMGLLVCMGLSGGLAISLFSGVTHQLSPLAVLLILPVTWAVCYGLGAALGDQVGIADEVVDEAQRQYRSWNQGLGEDLMAAGCLMVGAQFLFGNLYSAADYFRRGAGSTQRLMTCTAVIVVALSNPRGLGQPDLVKSVTEAQPSLPAPEVRAAITMLQARGYLEGDVLLTVPPPRKVELVQS